MKYLTLILVIVLSVGCPSLANAHEPEKMADLASQLKDISAAVDGTLKFSTKTYTDPQALLMAAINSNKNNLTPFEDYQLKVFIQDKNAILLLCEDDILLIEDAGCTAPSDIQHWQSIDTQACKVTINASKICKR
ncbi:hypothetical protein H5186_00755 [Pseudoalteromonas sp. SG41-2]|uniref:hypothetical protein n=1 Tax=Pseudoalteromonas sp. SG41-2 TaxID=2760978 RepID=UPI001602942E|nr:hypothetical protein [Pseudoalteromonas sp. SG41-2]MBB1478007.1 hypothetical protein [Pseudoalteromonas sp. SG41-2]